MQPHTWGLRGGVGFSPGTGPQSVETVRSGDLTSAELVRACRGAIGRQNWSSALRLADQGLGAESLTPEQEGVLRFSAGVAVMYLGDLFRAERELLAFLQLSESESGLNHAVGPAAYNLGHVCRTLDRPDDELRWFHRAVQGYEATGDGERVTVGLYDIAWSLICLGRLEEAKPYLSRVTSRVAETADREIQLDVWLAWALYYSVQGRLGESERMLRRVEGAGDLLPRHRAELHWIRGSNLLARGLVEAARAQVDLAYEATMDDWWPEQMKRIETLRIRIRQCQMV